MTRALELAGRRFGRLVVQGREENNHRGQSRWRVVCDCGQSIVASGSHLASGHTRSCGCLTRDTTIARSTKHGQGGRAHRTRAYTAWKEMNRRVRRDPHYVGLVEVCAEWATNFSAFHAEVGPCPDGYELDRVDNSKGYVPGNVRWVNETTQSRNRAFCVLTEHTAAQIRSDTRTYREIAEHHKCSINTVKSVKGGRAWKDVGKTIHIKD
jgi:hypothetical protein